MQQNPKIATAASQKRSGPERTCLGCRAKGNPRQMLRLVCTPAQVVCLDQTGRAPGRGVHVCCDAVCLRKVWKIPKLAMALRQPVQTPAFADLCCTIDDWLAERLRACVRLACKAGATISGYQALRMACIQKRVLYMILAADSTPIRQEAYRAWCVQQQIPTLVLGTKAALGDLIGKPSRSAIGFTSPHFCTLLGLTLSMQERWHASRLNTK